MAEVLEGAGSRFTIRLPDTVATDVVEAVTPLRLTEAPVPTQPVLPPSGVPFVTALSDDVDALSDDANGDALPA